MVAPKHSPVLVVISDSIVVTGISMLAVPLPDELEVRLEDLLLIADEAALLFEGL